MYRVSTILFSMLGTSAAADYSYQGHPCFGYNESHNLDSVFLSPSLLQFVHIYHTKFKSYILEEYYRIYQKECRDFRHL
jgi:hypothetical protein